MPEMILPGTYIEVRAEGLISAGRIATGNIGIVGTAERGDLDQVHLVTSLTEAKEIFGDSDEWIDGENGELTLIRALDLIYKNGGRNVYAVRTAAEGLESISKASCLLTQGASSLFLEAKTPGVWGNWIALEITVLEEAEQVTFSAKRAVLSYKQRQEVYEFSNLTELQGKIENASSLVIASIPESAKETIGDESSDISNLPEVLGDKKSFEFINGNNGGLEVVADDYKRGLQLLENQDVNIVLLAGQCVTSGPSGSAMVGALQGHLNQTATIKRERIGIIGSGFEADGNSLQQIVPVNNDGRLIFTAPGVVVTANGKPAKLPGGYLAAAVAGLISSLPIHSSPTNKVLSIEGLTTPLNIAELERLVQSRICTVEQRNGFRIVKGITTSDGAWQQITTRRIVDYAIYGVRSSCDPYIGKLNNERVRGAMKATLDGFLTRMVEDEALVSYQLEVSATRAQEIAGEAVVNITLSPTFSIDFIKVTMYLT